MTLSAENKRQFWVPEDFAYDFVVTGEDALFSYKCTDYYAPEHDGSILWNDLEIGLEWPIENPTLSGKAGKDGSAPPLAGMPEGSLPAYPAS